jgi:acyl-coenzyme A synthetase/AMP-(fatty) acid ligase
LDAAKLVNIPVENIFIFGHQDYQGARSFNKAFLDSDELAIPIEYTPKELTSVPCFFWFTSGTTGKGKAVTMTWVE